MKSRVCDLFVVLLFLSSACIPNGHHGAAAQPDSKPLVKRPEGTKYKTLLSIDGAGLRGIVPVVVLIEVEQSIKRYLLAHPELLPVDAAISSLDDFDINLPDYFDCMTALSSATWTALYLASRGGQGASRAVLDDPVIVEEYGIIPTGGAEGLRVFFREYGAMIYPTLNGSSTFTQEDFTNPSAPGIATPLYPLEGTETALEAFLGNTTLLDVDTSLLIPSLDSITGTAVFFVRNAFRDPPVTSTGRLHRRTTPQRTPGDGTAFLPDFVFDEGKDYFLVDVGSGATAISPLTRSKQMTQANNDTIEFVLIDGIFTIQYGPFHGSFFVARENALPDFEEVAVLSLGAGLPMGTLTPFANAGAANWLLTQTLISMFTGAGQWSTESLMDDIFYANPNTRRNQYLRVQYFAPIESEDGQYLSSFDSLELFDEWETIGTRMAETYRDSIDAFVRDFIFG